MGFELLWVAEHLLTARGLDTAPAGCRRWKPCPYVAGATQRIKPARTGILILAIRNPVFMAEEIASLQYLSGGRFELGVGAGWDAHEFAVAGVPLEHPGGRTDDILDIFARLWTGEPVTHQGKYYQFEDVTIEPRLPEQPFLWVAGGAKAKTSLSPDPETIAPSVLERICRRADGWIARAAGSNRSVIAGLVDHPTRRLDRDRPGARRA